MTGEPEQAATQEPDQADRRLDGAVSVGGQIAERYRHAGPWGGPRPSRIGALAASSMRFVSGWGRPAAVRRALATDWPSRSADLGGFEVGPPRWWFGATPADGRLPARGLRRAVGPVPDEASRRPGGIPATMTAQAVPMQLPEEVTAAGRMTTPADARARRVVRRRPRSASSGRQSGQAGQSGLSRRSGQAGPGTKSGRNAHNGPGGHGDETGGDPEIGRAGGDPAPIVGPESPDGAGGASAAGGARRDAGVEEGRLSGGSSPAAGPPGYTSTLSASAVALTSRLVRRRARATQAVASARIPSNRQRLDAGPASVVTSVVTRAPARANATRLTSNSVVTRSAPEVASPGRAADDVTPPGMAPPAGEPPQRGTTRDAGGQAIPDASAYVPDGTARAGKEAVAAVAAGGDSGPGSLAQRSGRVLGPITRAARVLDLPRGSVAAVSGAAQSVAALGQARPAAVSIVRRMSVRGRSTVGAISASRAPSAGDPGAVPVEMTASTEMSASTAMSSATEAAAGGVPAQHGPTRAAGDRDASPGGLPDRVFSARPDRMGAPAPTGLGTASHRLPGAGPARLSGTGPARLPGTGGPHRLPGAGHHRTTTIRRRSSTGLGIDDPQLRHRGDRAPARQPLQLGSHRWGAWQPAADPAPPGGAGSGRRSASREPGTRGVIGGHRGMPAATTVTPVAASMDDVMGGRPAPGTPAGGTPGGLPSGGVATAGFAVLPPRLARPPAHAATPLDAGSQNGAGPHDRADLYTRAGLHGSRGLTGPPGSAGWTSSAGSTSSDGSAGSHAQYRRGSGPPPPPSAAGSPSTSSIPRRREETPMSMSYSFLPPQEHEPGGSGAIAEPSWVRNLEDRVLTRVDEWLDSELDDRVLAVVEEKVREETERRAWRRGMEVF
ncbi:hypothetical protein [Ruania rhizosphaerae]|uniref:hypothetical protein n=1 Tax=Ruania rhizosphaerae TaxID=1840413 RepID=UPI00135A471A|nr:hypothetical protein [Ruania rhizosphaerae]